MISMASRVTRAHSCRAHTVAYSNLRICPLAIFVVRSAMSFVFHNSVRVIEPAPLIRFSRNRRCPCHLLRMGIHMNSWREEFVDSG